jgi:D-alanyl-D-alanine endopeptidase (penicillin-binding protein 7)
MDRRLTLSHLVGSYLPGRSYSRGELFDAMLVKSDNAAAETLAQDYPGGRRAFVVAMNHRAQQLGLTHTSFEDASGLGHRNVSTAREVGDLIRWGSTYAVIREASRKHQIQIETTYRKRVRVIELAHTNRSLLFEFDNIIASKTGLTSAAGWCVALLVQQADRQYVVVVLGSRTRQARLDTVKNLMYNHVRPPV